jgi:molecular chaperone DnaK (HSP70)
MALVEPSGLVNMIDIVLDEQSQRKTPSLLGFDSVDERLIGANAESLARR